MIKVGPILERLICTARRTRRTGVLNCLYSFTDFKLAELQFRNLHWVVKQAEHVTLGPTEKNKLRGHANPFSEKLGT